MANYYISIYQNKWKRDLIFLKNRKIFLKFSVQYLHSSDCAMSIKSVLSDYSRSLASASRKMKKGRTNSECMPDLLWAPGTACHREKMMAREEGSRVLLDKLDLLKK